MRARAVAVILGVVAGAVPLIVGPTAAHAACKAGLRPGSWSGDVTQQFTVNGTGNGGITVNQTGTSAATLTLTVKCNGKATGTIGNGRFSIDGSFAAGPISFPVQCTGTSGERSVTGTVKKVGGKPVIDVVYGPPGSETFQCAPGPFGDALNRASAEAITSGTTTPGTPNGISLPATAANRTTVRGDRFESTGGFDPIALATQNLAQIGLTPTVTQAWELNRS